MEIEEQRRDDVMKMIGNRIPQHALSLTSVFADPR